MSRNLGIVGRGKIGSAIGQLFSNNEWYVEYFDLIPEKRTAVSLKQLADKSELIIIAAPSRENRKIASELSPHIKGKILGTVAKGVEPGFVTMHEVLEDVSHGKFDAAILHGPMLASEITANKPTTIMFASNNKQWSANFRDNSQIKIVYSDDPYSVALCGVLKNIYSVVLGLNDGLGLGSNSKGALTVNIIREFRRLLVELGGNMSFALGEAGLGDLLATGYSEQSFNYKTGKKLSRNPDRSELKGEGVNALKEMNKKVKLRYYPIVQTLYSIIYENARPTILKKLEYKY